MIHIRILYKAYCPYGIQVYTVSPRRLDPFHIITYYIKWVKTLGHTVVCAMVMKLFSFRKVRFQNFKVCHRSYKRTLLLSFLLSLSITLFCRQLFKIFFFFLRPCEQLFIFFVQVFFASSMTEQFSRLRKFVSSLSTQHNGIAMSAQR